MVKEMKGFGAGLFGEAQLPKPATDGEVVAEQRKCGEREKETWRS